MQPDLSPRCVSMGAMTIATFIAILVGPAFAVCLTRWLDNRRVKSARRWDILRDLMRNRRDPMNPNFVGALNLIEVEFSKDKKVTKAWKDLFAEFNRAWPKEPSENERALLQQSRLEAQTRLLSAVAKNLGLSIEQLDIHGGYSPRAWGDLEDEQAHIRQLVREVADGKRAVNVVVWEGKKYKPNKAP